MATRDMQESERLAQKRWKEFAGMALVGDGTLGLLTPERHCRLWDMGPEPCRKLVEWFAGHPSVTRVLAAVEVGLGVWLASHQTLQLDTPSGAGSVRKDLRTMPDSVREQ